MRSVLLRATFSCLPVPAPDVPKEREKRESRGIEAHGRSTRTQVRGRVHVRKAGHVDVLLDERWAGAARVHLKAFRGPDSAAKGRVVADRSAGQVW